MNAAAPAVDSCLWKPTTTSICGSTNSSSGSPPKGKCARRRICRRAQRRVLCEPRSHGRPPLSLDSWGTKRQELQLKRRRSEIERQRSLRLTARPGRNALAALRAADNGGEGHPRRDFALEQKLEHAAAVPLEIAALGADAPAILAALVWRTRRRHVSGRRLGGRSACRWRPRRAAAHLVPGEPGARATADPRLARARASEETASDAADRLLDSLA